MQGVSIDGNYVGFDCSSSPCVGSNDLRGILHHKGQVVFAADKSSNTITGNFSIKEYNIYITTKAEEELLFNTKYQVNPRINQNLAGLTNEEETYPAIFLKNMGLCHWAIDSRHTTRRSFHFLRLRFTFLGVVINYQRGSLTDSERLIRSVTRPDRSTPGCFNGTRIIHYPPLILPPHRPSRSPQSM